MCSSLLVIMIGSHNGEINCHRIIDAAPSFGLETLFGVGSGKKLSNTQSMNWQCMKTTRAQGLHYYYVA